MGKDIIVLGGGVIGLSIAFECQRRGDQVLVLDVSECGGQASGAAAGMLAPYSEISEDPDDFFHLCVQSLHEFPSWQEEIKQLSGIDFEYRKTGSLTVILHEAERLSLETRKDWQQQFGCRSEVIERDRLREIEPNLSDEIIAALYTPEETHLYAPDYVKALKQACISVGVQIYERLEQTEIVEWQREVHVRSKDQRSFFADHLVVATGAWSSELEETFDIKIPVFPIRGQICAYEIDEPIRHLIFSSQGYLVSKTNGSLVCGASEDIAGFDTRVTEKGVGRLERWSKKLLPQLHDLSPYHRWAGLRPATRDGFPLLGSLSSDRHILFATGHYRNGILLSPITAKVIADHLNDLPERLPLTAFSPERFS